MNATRAAAIEIRQLDVRRGGRSLARIDEAKAQRGAFVAMVGPNGAGKSSVLKAITGEWRAAGQLALLGRPFQAWDRRALARHLAVMTQHPVLQFDFTVREVVALGRLPHRGEGRTQGDSRVLQALQMLGLSAFSARRYTTLSGGERQRVQYARVVCQLLGTPSSECLLLLDEPTSALDLAQQKSVLDHAWAMTRQGATVVAVMHDLNTVVRYADRVWVMAGGELRLQADALQALTTETIRSVFGLDLALDVAARDGRPVILMQPDTGAPLVSLHNLFNPSTFRSPS